MEEVLPGGLINTVKRMGDTVRRPMPQRAEYVHALLAFLEEYQWPGATRFLGTDAHNREILSFISGSVPWRPEDRGWSRSDENLCQVVKLLRELHDLTAGSPLAQPGSVICHNDLSPRNTVYRDGSPVAFLDWDLAAPGERIEDVAHLCWQFLRLGEDDVEPTEAGRQLALVRQVYGLAHGAPLVETILWWQRRSASGIEHGAASGEPALVALCDSGVPASIRNAADWVVAHRAVLGQ